MDKYGWGFKFQSRDINFYKIIIDNAGFLCYKYNSKGVKAFDDEIKFLILKG